MHKLSKAASSSFLVTQAWWVATLMSAHKNGYSVVFILSLNKAVPRYSYSWIFITVTICSFPTEVTLPRCILRISMRLHQNYAQREQKHEHTANGLAFSKELRWLVWPWTKWDPDLSRARIFLRFGLHLLFCGVWMSMCSTVHPALHTSEEQRTDGAKTIIVISLQKGYQPLLLLRRRKQFTSA